MIPNLFSKVKIPDTIPKGMQDVVDDLKKSKDKKDCLKRAYDFLSDRFVGCHIFIRFFDLFVTDLDKLWNRSEKSHCTNLNYLLRVLLIKSEFFKEEDVKPKLTTIYISPHQYLKVMLNKEEFINVDPWGAKYHIKFGKYANSSSYKLFRGFSGLRHHK